MSSPDRLWDDFAIFARAEIASGDADASLRVLGASYEGAKLPPEIALWRSLLWLTWAHEGSAERVWTAHPEPGPIDAGRFDALPTGIERRGFRGLVGGAAARAFVAAVLARAGGKLAAWASALGSGPIGWRSARAELEAVPGGGPWASWRWADLLGRVHGIPIAPPGLSQGNATRSIVRALGRDDELLLLARTVDAGVKIEGFAQLDAIAANFSALGRGLYYVGFAIDQQGTTLDAASPLWAARRRAFPEAYLGEREKPARVGIRPDLRSAYARRGELVNIWT